MIKFLEKNTLKPEFLTLAQVSIGAAAFGLLLLIPPPPLFSRLFYQPDWRILITLFIFFALLLRRTGKGWETLQVALVFGLFAMPLIYKWQFAHYDGNLIGGLLPWSDASGYYWQAYRLANGSLFTAWGGRRPLFASFLAVVLRLSGGDFMASLVILTLVNIIAILIVLQAIKRWYGAIGVTAYLLISYEFYMRFAGITLTEQLGFALGNLALFFLLVGVQTRSFWRALFGLGILTLALNARAGAFFILPVLILWLAFYFRKHLTFWHSAGSAIVVVVAAFLLNIFLARVVTGQQGTAFSNYSYTLYGLASGNKGWTQVAQDYPKATESEIMPLAIQKIRENPVMLLYGIQESYKDYFKPFGGAFSFTFLGADQPKANMLLWGVVLLGLIHSFLIRKTGTGGLVLISFLGVFASLSLLPPIDADSMRAFAATIPFTALWVAAGVSAPFAWGRKQVIQIEPKPTEEIGPPYQKLALEFSALIIALAISGPLLLMAFPIKGPVSSSLSEPACCSAQELLHGVVFDNTSVILIRKDAALESYMPFIRVSDFRRPITSGYPFLDEELLKLRPGDRITYGLILENENASISLYMISDFPVKEGEFTVCGLATDNEQLRNYAFYDLEGAKVQPYSLTFSQQHRKITLIIRLFYGSGLGLVLFLLIFNIFSSKRSLPVNDF